MVSGGAWLRGSVGGEGRRGGRRTGDGVVAAVFGAHATVAVAVVARHGLLGEEGEGLLEDCPEGGWMVSIGVDLGAKWKLPARRRSWYGASFGQVGGAHH